MRRKYNRRKRIIIAYTLRTIVFLVLLGAITLMVCGVIYLYELFHKDDRSQQTYLYEAEDRMSDHNLENNSSYFSKEINEEYKGVRIVLDAGHGGEDGGTSSQDVAEKDITLAIVLYMQEMLEKQGIEVVLTREEDVFLSLEERAAMENRADADLFISIHCNYFEDDSSVQGLECYYYKESEEGRQLAEALIESLKQRDNVTVRSAKEDSFYVLKNTKSPAVLVEVGFLSNKKECEELSGDEYQRKMAEKLVECLKDVIISEKFGNSR